MASRARTRARIVAGAALATLLAACGDGAPSGIRPTASKATAAPSSTSATTSQSSLPADPVINGYFPVSGGRKMHLVCYGAGSPTVILEPGGTDIPGTRGTPRSTLLTLGALTRACVYDRLDTGADPGAPSDHSIFADDADMRAMLTAAGVEGPFVYVGTSFGGTFALAHALADPASAAGLVIVDTDFPQADVTRRCVALGVPRKACGPDPGDALAEGWNREVAHRVASLGDRPVRVLTSTVFDPSCPTRFDCPLINKRTVAFQSSDWSKLTRDFRRTLVPVRHDDLSTQAETAIVAAIEEVLAEADQ